MGVKKISPQEAKDRKMFGPVYHGTTETARQAIKDEGFKVFIGTERSGDVRQGYEASSYADSKPAPIHHLGFGVYFTTVKAIAKHFAGGTEKGLKTYYLDVPRLETINFGSPGNMMKWWVKEGYDIPRIYPLKEGTNVPALRLEATKNLTNNLKSKYDAVWFKGKGIKRLLDGDQVCVFDPSRIYELDTKLAKEGEIGSKVRRKSDGMLGVIRGKRAVTYEPAKAEQGPWYFEIKWAKGGTDFNVKEKDIEFLTKGELTMSFKEKVQSKVKVQAQAKAQVPAKKKYPLTSNFAKVVQSRYEVRAGLVEKFKRAFIPALLSIFTTHCGMDKMVDEKLAEQKMNKATAPDKVSCVVENKQDGSSYWTFTQKAEPYDALVVQIAKDGDLRTVQEPKTEEMKALEEAFSKSYEEKDIESLNRKCIVKTNPELDPVVPQEDRQKIADGMDDSEEFEKLEILMMAYLEQLKGLDPKDKDQAVKNLRDYIYANMMDGEGTLSDLQAFISKQKKIFTGESTAESLLSEINKVITKYKPQYVEQMDEWQAQWKTEDLRKLKGLKDLVSDFIDSPEFKETPNKQQAQLREGLEILNDAVYWLEAPEI